MENNTNRQVVLNSILHTFNGMVFAKEDLECLHLLSFDGYRWLDEFALFTEYTAFDGIGEYMRGVDLEKDFPDCFIKPKKLYHYIKLLHQLGYKQVTLKSGPTEVISQKLYEISFWRNDDLSDDHYECADILATNEAEAIEVLRSDLKDEFGFAHFVIDKIKLLYDKSWKF